MLESKEINYIQTQLSNLRGTYGELSDFILERILELKNDHPKAMRVAFSRQPKVKEFDSIIKKIELCRIENPKFQFKDLSDIIALTILCPYESDVAHILGWIARVFDVEPSSSDAALRDHSSGHRAYHFILKLKKPDLIAFPKYHSLRCELQIKTILQEAFDAKSHDLAYKPGKLEVGATLKKQFVHLSGHLQAIDGQSEFLKDLILKNRKEVELRRRACLRVYVKNFGDAADKLQLDPNNLPDLAKIAEAVENPDLEITRNLCKFVAYCATSLDSEYLKRLALGFCEKYVETHPDDERRLFGRGSMYWALGYHEKALQDMQAVIEDNQETANESACSTSRDAKNNFVYFTCDWEVFSSDVPPQYVAKAASYIEALKVETKPAELDTLGLYKIIYSSSITEIDYGRQLLVESLRQRIDDRDIYQSFYDLHQFVAINRMMRILLSETASS